MSCLPLTYELLYHENLLFGSNLVINDQIDDFIDHLLLISVVLVEGIGLRVEVVWSVEIMLAEVTVEPHLNPIVTIKAYHITANSKVPDHFK